MSDTPNNLTPCPPHQWRYAAIAGHFSCLKCSERVAPFDPRYRQLADEWEADGVEKALTPPMSDADWQPIETAPKDGTRLLLGCTKYLHMTGGQPEPVHVGWWDSSEDKWSVEGRAIWQPTNWMPLPAPPVARAALAALASTSVAATNAQDASLSAERPIL